MIKLFLIISLLFFNIIQVWTFAINLEENDNSSNYVDKKFSLNLNKNESSFCENVFSFNLVNVCKCMQITKDENESINYNHVFTFEDFKCFDRNIMVKYHQHINIDRIRWLFQISKFNDHSSVGKELIESFLFTLNFFATHSSNPEEKKYFTDMCDIIRFYIQLSSNEKLVLKEDEPNFFNNVMDNLMQQKFFAKNCFFEKNIKAWVWDLSRSKFKLRIVNNQYCFIRTFVVPVNCNIKRNLIEIAKSIIKQLEKDVNNNKFKTMFEEYTKRACETKIDQFLIEYQDLKASQTCRNPKDDLGHFGI